MDILRKQEEIILNSIKKEPKIIILYGPRQSGKTTLMAKIVGKLSADLGLKTLQYSGDSLDHREILGNARLDYLKSLVGANTLLVVDEAQKIPDIGLVLKLIFDHLKIRIIISGSSSLELSQKVNEPLTGRSEIYYINPISLYELDFNVLHTPQKRLEEFLIYGMYPKSVVTSITEDKATYLSNLFNNYLYKDILEFEQIRKPDKVIQLLKLLALQVGSEVSVSELARQLNMAVHTVEVYLDLLQKIFVVYKLYGFSRNLRKEISKMPKYFFYDVGMRNALLGNFNRLENRNDVGQLFENFCVMEKIKSAEIFQTRGNFYFWRTHDQQEIDVVLERGGHIAGFEFKYGIGKLPRAPKIFLETYSASYTPVNQDNFFEMLK